MMRSSVVLPLPDGPSSAVSDPSGDVQRDVVEGDEVAEPLGQPVNLDGHRCVLLRNRPDWYSCIASRTRMAINASTSDAV